MLRVDTRGLGAGDDGEELSADLGLVERLGRKLQRYVMATRPGHDLVGPGQYGQARRDAVERARSLLLRLLPLLPYGVQVVGRILAREHVRVAGDQLVADASRHVIDGERVPLRGDLRVERDLQEEVAELLAEVVIGARLDRVHHLGGLFDQVVQQRRMRLLGVPRAACPQRVHHRHEPPQLVLGVHENYFLADSSDSDPVVEEGALLPAAVAMSQVP